ncbi:hypothetical protein V500_01492 [Pseudogymnoascus sp. VKM F-4518 (FW-2643)]|nr:hypothetical protein V500_01492 [Pseudogymnoascus sp. VKM F-4518 (FW-2643)]
MTINPLPFVHADDEWSPLKAVIVGRAGRSCFPSAPGPMIAATMPAAHVHRFQPKSPFPEGLVAKAELELNQFAAILEAEGIKVYRPPSGIDWLAEDGYTGAMPRDGLMSVNNVLIEACFAWSCRALEIEIAYGPILDEGGQGRQGDSCSAAGELLRRYSAVSRHVTNQAGVDYMREKLPTGYRIEMLEVNDPSAMHIDATILPLRKGLLVYNPKKVTEEALRKHEILADWKLQAYPYIPQEREDPPLYMTSPWLCLNALVLNGEKVVVEASDSKTARWFLSLRHCGPGQGYQVNAVFKLMRVGGDGGTLFEQGWP